MVIDLVESFNIKKKLHIYKSYKILVIDFVL